MNKNYLLKITLISLIFFSLVFSFAFAQVKKGPKVVLSWSTPGTAPLFYKGKVLPTLNSRVSANADLINGDEKNFIFKWFLDDDYRPFSSGLGKNKFNFTAKKAAGDIYTVKIELRENTKAENLITQMSVNILMAELEIIFYNSHDLAPIPSALEKEINLSSGQNIEIVAEPYFFQNSLNLAYEWFSSGSLIQSTEERKNLLTINVPKKQPIQPVSKHIKLRLTKTSLPAQRQEKELILKIF